MNPDKASPVQCKNADLLPLHFLLQLANLLEVDDDRKHDPTVNPLLVDKMIMKDMPPCHLMVCGYDTLRDHGLLYKQKLDQNG